MKHKEMQVPGCQEVQLHAQAWLPDGSRRPCSSFRTGSRSTAGATRNSRTRLVEERGYAVYALDHRGHGRSGGERANIERFQYVVSDLGTFVGRAQRQHPDAPVFLLGHSMGGAIALACVVRNPGGLKGLVLSAPALASGQAVSPVKAWLVRLLSRVAPNTGALTLPADADQP